MILDAFTASFVSGLIFLTAAAIFVVTSLVRRDRGPVQLWSLGYLLSAIGVIAYVVWNALIGSGWASTAALAVGNATMVAAAAALAIGCRVADGRPAGGPLLLGLGLGVATAISTLVDGPDAGAWAGGTWLFLSIGIFAAVGSWYCLRGRLSRFGFGKVLGIAFLAEAVVYILRGVVVITVGSGQPLFQVWLGSGPVSAFFIVFTVVVLVATSILRYVLGPRETLLSAGAVMPGMREGYLDAEGFRRMVDLLLRKGSERTEFVVVCAVHIDAAEDISASFGGDVLAELRASVAAAARRYSVANALLAIEHGVVLTCAMAASPPDARRQAALLYRGVIETLVQEDGVVLPAIGVGAALSTTVGFETSAMVDGARAAAARAAATDEASVVFAPSVSHASSR
ncbi:MULTISPECIES: UbiA prenyltransferase family protein [Microbacterium]|uniref:hypothetical protein n=1 Tax=Microbacterium TaxID=33882 RepID=UPI0010F717DD|nr:hypothetical protein [Microbacterium sp. 4NA327F11]MCK9917153.1 hypothetical protein [Microbacteriaceae bacterium K1510]